MNHRVLTQDITAHAFARLGREKQLLEYSGIIFQMLGVVIDYISAEGETLRLSKGVNFNPFCTLLRNSPRGCSACNKCDIEHGLDAAQTHQPVCYSCYAGLHEILVPLFDNQGNYIGAMTSGQFHLEGKPLFSRRKINRLAREYGLEEKPLWDFYRQSISLTRRQIEGLIGYLKIIGRHLTSVREHLIFMDKINMPDKIEAVKKYIEQHYADPLDTASLARHFYISPDYLAHSFRQTMNIPLHKYLTLCRLSKAKGLLLETRLSVVQIAVLTGFGSISQFNRIFRNEEGCSAQIYRQRHAANSTL